MQKSEGIQRVIKGRRRHMLCMAQNNLECSREGEATWDKQNIMLWRLQEVSQVIQRSNKQS